MKVIRYLTLLLASVMLFGTKSQTVMAADATEEIDLSTVITGKTDNTGNKIYTCEKKTINGKDEYFVTIEKNGSYTLKGTIDQPNDPIHPTHVVVSAKEADIRLDGVSITLINYSPLSINPGSTVHLTIADGTINTLSTAGSTVAAAGIYVPEDASVIIDGSGTLNATGCYDGGAGIGGGKGNGCANAGNITINSGIINATAGWEGAGIGGGDGGNCGNIIINGGTITATGGDRGAAIGNGRSATGGSIIFTGGKVTAKGGENADGIGGDSLYASESGKPIYPSDITISGGTVIATSIFGSGICGTNVSVSGGIISATGMRYGIGGDCVTISAGTVNTNGIRKGIGNESTGKNIFTGGSIKTNSVNPAPSNGTDPVVNATIKVIDKNGSKLVNSKITCTMPSGVKFDALTDSEGKLHLYLPVGENKTIAIKSDSIDFTVKGNITADGPNQFITASPISSVKVAPAAVEVERGKTQIFTAEVEGESDPIQAVTWSVEGGTYGTSIDNTGKLTIAIKEKAETLTVKATSVVDETKFGTATVKVTKSDACLMIGSNIYKTWAEATDAVKAGETITLLQDVTMQPGDTFPKVECIISGGDGDGGWSSSLRIGGDGYGSNSVNTLILNGNQSLQADIILSNLLLDNLDKDNYAQINCSDLHDKYRIGILGLVSATNIYIEGGSELNIEGVLSIEDIYQFEKLSISSDSLLSVFSASQIENADINGMVTCKYLALEKKIGESGLLTGKGRIKFIESGGNAANLIFDNVKIDSSVQIRLDPLYEAHDRDLVIANKNVMGTGPASPLDNINCLTLGKGYSGFNLITMDRGFAFAYLLEKSTYSLAEVKELIADAKIYAENGNGFTTASLQALLTAIDNASALTEASDQTQLKSCANALKSAMQGLKGLEAIVTLVATPSNSAVLIGAGNYLLGDVVHIVAKPLSGYRFIGWYTVNYDHGASEIMYSSVPSFQYQISGMTHGKITFTAKYEANAAKKLSVSVGNGKVNYSYNQTNGIWETDISDQSISKGTYITLTAQANDGASFLYWMNADTGRVLSNQVSYSFYVSEDMKLTACYKAAVNMHTVIFQDMNGTVLKTEEVAEGDSASAPEHGNFTGYTFTGWDKVFSAVTEDITVIAQYKKTNVYVLTVSGGAISVSGGAISVSGGAIASQTYAQGDYVTVVAENVKDGNYFSGWYNGDRLVSVKQQYSFYITEDTSLTARFEGGAVIVEQPMVNLSLSGRTNLGNGAQTVLMTVQWSVPEGYSILGSGLVRTLTDTYKDSLTLENVDGTNVKRNTSTLMTSDGTYANTLTLGASSKTKNLYVKGYVTYQNINTGEIKTIYTDCVVSYSN